MWIKTTNNEYIHSSTIICIKLDSKWLSGPHNALGYFIVGVDKKGDEKIIYNSDDTDKLKVVSILNGLMKDLVSGYHSIVYAVRED